MSKSFYHNAAHQTTGNKKVHRNSIKITVDLVPVAGVEPARCCHRGILSYLLHTEHRRTQPPAEVVDGHQKVLPILLFLKLICRKAPFRLPFPLFSILTEILDFGGTSEGCYPQTEHNSTRNRFINRKHIIAYFSAIDNTLSEKEVSL